MKTPQGEYPNNWRDFVPACVEKLNLQFPDGDRVEGGYEDGDFHVYELWVAPALRHPNDGECIPLACD